MLLFLRGPEKLGSLHPTSQSKQDHLEPNQNDSGIGRVQDRHYRRQRGKTQLIRKHSCQNIYRLFGE